MSHHGLDLVTHPVEYFTPSQTIYNEVTLLDCNDSFTHNLVQAFLTLGAPVRVFRSHHVSVDDVIDQLGKYLVLSPGPGIPDEAGIVKELYKLTRGSLPILGVCLGMQSMNEVLGGTTVPSPVPVHGKVSSIEHSGNSIFVGVPSPTEVARYHSLMVDPAPDLEILSEYNGVIMAFRLSDRSVAVQFHPESFLTTHGLQILQNFLEGKI